MSENAYINENTTSKTPPRSNAHSAFLSPPPPSEYSSPCRTARELSGGAVTEENRDGGLDVRITLCLELSYVFTHVLFKTVQTEWQPLG